MSVDRVQQACGDPPPPHFRIDSQIEDFQNVALNGAQYETDNVARALGHESTGIVQFDPSPNAVHRP